MREISFMDNTLCIHAFVSGRVQGVFYRDSTQKQAIKLGIVGWVKNCDDGRVEVVAKGEKEDVEKLIKWLKKGPQFAKVASLDWREVEKMELDDGFLVIR